jgi:hypothetical protein
MLMNSIVVLATDKSGFGTMIRLRRTQQKMPGDSKAGKQKK